ncbi:MAG: permease [Candidatus Sedimenticola sp. (ex Thyasira tokunagai)]
MSKSSLILSQTPALKVPLRFFLTAPLFGVAVAVAMLWQGASIFTTRWSSGLLAINHLLVLGYIGMVMQGALLQIVSVVLGERPPHVDRLSMLMHLFLTAGTLLLAAGFLMGSATAMQFAILLLALSFLLFFGSIVSVLPAGAARHDVKVGVALALGCLVVTLISGVWLAMGYGWNEIAPARQLTDLHLAWGLLGWIGVLVVTVAYEVVPMFQVTPAYPKRISRWLGLTIFVSLIAWSSWMLSAPTIFSGVGGLLLAVGFSLFASTTLWLQFKRKKKQADSTIWFWRCAMLSLLAAIFCWMTAQFFPVLMKNSAYPMLLAVLMIVGFAVSVINGMLYKILPFLTWVHLTMMATEHKASRRLIPNIKKIIPEPPTRIQFALHLLALLLMALCAWRASLFLLPAAVVFAASNLLLWWNLIGALRVYNRVTMEIEAASLPGR